MPQWQDLLAEAGAEPVLCLSGATNPGQTSECTCSRPGSSRTGRAGRHRAGRTTAAGNARPGHDPVAVTIVDALPLTANGKIDRATLSTWAEQRPGTSQAVLDAGGRSATALEEQVARAYAVVLREPDVGLDTNFYALGGDSLLAAQVVTQLRDTVPAATEVFFDELAARTAQRRIGP